MLKRLFISLLVICLLFGSSLAESIPMDAETPYAPVLSALSEDGLSYDDGTLSVRIVKDIAFDTNVYYVYVSISDPSQLRTALASPYPSDKLDKAVNIAQRNNAVLAINGDFFIYHNSGFVCRQGKVLRNSPAKQRDTLIVDEKGDLHSIVPSTKKNIEDYDGTIVQAFCFGPSLIIDGEAQNFNYRDKVSCGYPTKAQRLVFCQLDTLSYLFIATEGPEQDEPGLSIPEMMTLIEPLHPLQAYNLDGGSSTSIILCGNKINAVNSKNRSIGDIIYFATLVSDQADSAEATGE